MIVPKLLFLTTVVFATVTKRATDPSIGCTEGNTIRVVCIEILKIKDLLIKFFARDVITLVGVLCRGQSPYVQTVDIFRDYVRMNPGYPLQALMLIGRIWTVNLLRVIHTKSDPVSNARSMPEHGRN